MADVPRRVARFSVGTNQKEAMGKVAVDVVPGIAKVVTCEAQHAEVFYAHPDVEPSRSACEALYHRNSYLYVGASMSNSTQRNVVAKVGEVQPGHTKKFMMTIGGNEEECFLVNFGGELRAYVNRCCHVPMSLDWVENQFFTEDGQFIQCATHGACYLPDTGECVSGPPCGKFLTRIPLAIEADCIVADAGHA